MKTGYWLPDYQKFLQQLVQARKEAKLTQKEVAKILQKPQSFISKCEKGERRVDALELQRFAEIYEKSLYYFLEESEANFS